MLSDDDEQGKHLDDQHAPPCVRKLTQRWDEEQWDRLRDQNAILHERLLFAWETTQELLGHRYQIVQDHQDLLRQRQRLLEQQAAYLQSISSGRQQAHASG